MASSSPPPSPTAMPVIPVTEALGDLASSLLLKGTPRSQLVIRGGRRQVRPDDLPRLINGAFIWDMTADLEEASHDGMLWILEPVWSIDLVRWVRLKGAKEKSGHPRLEQENSIPCPREALFLKGKKLSSSQVVWYSLCYSGLPVVSYEGKVYHIRDPKLKEWDLMEK